MREAIPQSNIVVDYTGSWWTWARMDGNVNNLDFHHMASIWVQDCPMPLKFFSYSRDQDCREVVLNDFNVSPP